MLNFTLPLIAQTLLLLAIRLILVIIFVAEVKIKLKDIKAFAKNDGIPLGAAYFLVIAEAAAALSMLTGIMAQWAALGIILLMIITICLHIFKWHSPYWANKRGWEYDLLILLLAGVILVFGAGDLALFA